MSTKVTIKGLHPNDKEGFMTKQGGSVKSWRRRWFILKGTALYYFKKNKPDTEEQGQINITAQSFVKQEEKHGKKHAFSVGASKRVYHMYADTEQESIAWIKAIGATIDRIKSGSGVSINSVVSPNVKSNLPSSEGGDNVTNDSSLSTSNNNLNTNEQGGSTNSSAGLSHDLARVIKDRLKDSKVLIPYLNNEGKIKEFWSIWFDSIPNEEDFDETTSPSVVQYEVSTSADMQKITWRANGPQNVIIQKMVDFFWNVGAPESEIDRLNDVGAVVNPTNIGSWIDISQKEGMDGGWCFPVNTPIELALEAGDKGEPMTKLGEWTKSNGISSCDSISRDMGAAPPRQTELKFKIPGDSFDSQLSVALTSFESFGFPPLPQEALSIIKSYELKMGVRLSVTTTSEGFVKLGVLLPSPDQRMIDRLCPMCGASSSEPLTTFSSKLGVSLPSFVEFQYLNQEYGYGVYKEGFDVIFHYDLK